MISRVRWLGFASDAWNNFQTCSPKCWFNGDESNGRKGHKHVKQIKAFRNLNTSSTDLFLGRRGHETTKKTRFRRRFVLNFVKRNLNETMQTFLLFNTVDDSNIRGTTHKNNSLINQLTQLTVLQSDFCINKYIINLFAQLIWFLQQETNPQCQHPPGSSRPC